VAVSLLAKLCASIAMAMSLLTVALGSGSEAYRSYCASCHGANLGGAAGPALTGEGFRHRWHGRVPMLSSVIANTMPYSAPASLTATEYTEITHYIVAENALARGDAEDSPGVGDRTSPRRSGEMSVPQKLPAAPIEYGSPSTTAPDDDELQNASQSDWLLYNHDYLGQRHSPLRLITTMNAAGLAPKCIFQTGEVGSFQSSPLIRAGRLYFTTANNTYALDAATCRKIWKHEYPPASAPLPVNRGVALYEGMVIRGTLDGHLIALDAETGTLLWDERVSDSRNGHFISAAPIVFDGKVYVGEAGGDFGAAGHVHAFEALTGKPLWTFDAVPTGERLGGGSTWTTITVDPATRRLFVPLGNPGSDFDGRERPGANLYSNSIVVIDTDSGKLDWYVQQNPHDVHDWDTAAAPVIYDQEGAGFLAVGSKDARLYIYDRNSHALIARKDLTKRVNDTLLLAETGTHVCPGFLGGVEWNGPAYDPLNRMVFVNTVDWCGTFKRAKNARENAQGGTGTTDPPSEARGWLRAFDAASGEERWSYEAGTPMLAGITTTAAGLLLTGSGDGDFLVFDAKTGRKLYGFYTGGSIGGGPSTYLTGGKQYIAIASGNNSKSLWQVSGASTLIVFGLP
jgi:alcohol dehydrogenase (cytochrome c)